MRVGRPGVTVIDGHAGRTMVVVTPFVMVMVVDDCCWADAMAATLARRKDDGFIVGWFAGFVNTGKMVGTCS